MTKLNMSLTEKNKIFYNIWCCAYQRRYMYRMTERGNREHETVLMCINGWKWWKFDTERVKML